jgi:hypothetical protein
VVENASAKAGSKVLGGDKFVVKASCGFGALVLELVDVVPEVFQNNSRVVVDGQSLKSASCFAEALGTLLQGELERSFRDHQSVFVGSLVLGDVLFELFNLPFCL